MKSKIVFTVFLLSFAVRAVQAQTASELFVKLPESTFLTLTVSDRLDLINMYKAGEKATIKNLLGDSCSILNLTDDFLQVKTSENTMELFLLPMINDSKIVGLIQTVCAPVCDSYLEFYTTSWKKLAASVFITFAGKNDFLKEGINPEDENVKNALIPLDISFIKLHYEPEKQELQQYYTSIEYLSETDRAKVKQYFNEKPKQFKWNLARFE